MDCADEPKASTDCANVPAEFLLALLQPLAQAGAIAALNDNSVPRTAESSICSKGKPLHTTFACA
jgi:hypothetical protein